MPTRTLWRRLLSPAGFALVAGFFFLPFVTVSCGTASGGGVAGTVTFSGTDLAIGGRPELSVSDEFIAGVHSQNPDQPPPPLDGIGVDYTDPVGPQPFMLITLLCVGAGILVAAIRWPWPRALAGGALALAAIAFLVGGEVISLRETARTVNKIAAEVVGEPGVAGIAYGFWLGLAVLVVLAAANWAALVRLSRTAPGPPGSVAPEPPEPPEPPAPPGPPESSAPSGPPPRIADSNP